MSFKTLSIVAAASMALFAGAANAVMTPVELAVNGDFSDGLNGWTTFNTSGGSNGTISVVDGAAVLDTGLPGFPMTLGIKNANIGIGTVMANEMVTVSFDVKGTYDVGGVSFGEFFSELNGGGVSKSDLLGGAPLFATQQCSGFNAATFTRCTFTTITGNIVDGGVTLQLVSSTGGAIGSLANTTFDNVSISVMRDIPPVPEPGTYAMMLAGLVGVGAIARRRRSL